MVTVSHQFLKSVLNSVAENIVVIDDTGQILFVNSSWNQFAHENGCKNTDWLSINYLETCHKAAVSGDRYGLEAISGIQRTLKGEIDEFSFEYPCHSPDIKRWFIMRIRPLTITESRCFVISHHDISERKASEEYIQSQAIKDGLTGVFNRSYFDYFLNNEWNRCKRNDSPISMAILDLDHFKQLNDSYGHQSGDRCLEEIGKILSANVCRASEICARYGGEEFALIFSDADLMHAKKLVSRISKLVFDLKFPNMNSRVVPWVTVSIGVASARPQDGLSPADLIQYTDKLLYKAKSQGRNNIQSGFLEPMVVDA